MVPFWGRCTTHFSGDWDVHWAYRILTHGHVSWGAVFIPWRERLPGMVLRKKMGTSRCHWASAQAGPPFLNSLFALCEESGRATQGQVSIVLRACVRVVPVFVSVCVCVC